MRCASTAVEASSCQRYLLLSPHKSSTAAIPPRSSGTAVLRRMFVLAGISTYPPAVSQIYATRDTSARFFWLGQGSRSRNAKRLRGPVPPSFRVMQSCRTATLQRRQRRNEQCFGALGVAMEKSAGVCGGDIGSHIGLELSALRFTTAQVEK